MECKVTRYPALFHRLSLREVHSRRKGRFNCKPFAIPFGFFQAFDQFFTSRNRMVPLREFILDLVDIQKESSRLEDWEQLAGKGGFSCSIGAGDEYGFRH